LEQAMDEPGGVMRAIVYRQTGTSDVLELVERPVPEPQPGEVRVRVRVSGVNPTDWKSRWGGGAAAAPPFPESVPNQDGAGTIDAAGQGVDPGRVGERVWLWEAAWQRANGTAQEAVCLPEQQAVRLPDEVSFDTGASLGIPALTAHRCLTVAEQGPDRLGPGRLSGRTILVAGGAGAVGHAAIQLARWAGGRVIATVSGDEKAALARAAGAEEVVIYREPDAAARIRRLAPAGVDIVVEVAAAANAGLDAAVLAAGGTVACYAAEPGQRVPLDVRDLMGRNIRYQFVLVYTVPDAAKRQAVADVAAAVAAGRLPAGADAGLPLHRFPLEQTAAAHDAVEGGAVGKVLIDVA
jgi:NADPH2:quinone reductase